MRKNLIILSAICYVLIGCAGNKNYTAANIEGYPGIHKKNNEYEDVTFYRDKAFFTVYPSPIEVYMGRKGGDDYLIARFKYRGSDWIFFDDFTMLNSEGDKIKYTFKSYDSNRRVVGSDVVESYEKDISVSEAQKILDFINKGDGVIKVRLLGDYHKDIVMRESHVSGLKEILNYALSK